MGAAREIINCIRHVFQEIKNKYVFHGTYLVIKPGARNKYALLLLLLIVKNDEIQHKNIKLKSDFLRLTKSEPTLLY